MKIISYLFRAFPLTSTSWKERVLVFPDRTEEARLLLYVVVAEVVLLRGLAPGEEALIMEDN